MSHASVYCSAPVVNLSNFSANIGRIMHPLYHTFICKVYLYLGLFIVFLCTP